MQNINLSIVLDLPYLMLKYKCTFSNARYRVVSGCPVN